MADGNSKTFLDKTFRVTQGKVIFVCFVLMMIAFWSVWKWYFLRLSTSNDESYGLLALLSVLGLCFFYKSNNLKQINLSLTTFFVFLYALSFPFLTPLLRSIVAVTAITFFLSGWRFGKVFHFGVWSLFLLSLPIIASLQFYLGFPLRVIVGEATAFLLKLNGLVVVREGVCLHFGEKLIWIDAPCSGIKMLWAGFFLTALLITLYKFNRINSLFAFTLAFFIILFGNILRATGLFFLEADLVKLPDFAHQGIGVICFFFTCFGIVWVLQKLRPTTKAVGFATLPINLEKLKIVFGLACGGAFLVPFLVQNHSNFTKTRVPEFPQTFEGKVLQELELTEREKFFLEDFPGEIKRMTDGEREIIIRYVTTPTRKLHSSSDCFSAIGFQIKPLPIKIDEKANRWACFSAKKVTAHLKVCERIYTDSGANWTDVSSWYWSAISYDSPQGFWAVTVAENDLE